MIDKNAIESALAAAGGNSAKITAAQIGQVVQAQGLHISPEALNGFVRCVIKNAPYAPVFTLVCECATDSQWTAPKGSSVTSA